MCFSVASVSTEPFAPDCRNAFFLTSCTLTLHMSQCKLCAYISCRHLSIMKEYHYQAYSWVALWLHFWTVMIITTRISTLLQIVRISICTNLPPEGMRLVEAIDFHLDHLFHTSSKGIIHPRQQEHNGTTPVPAPQTMSSSSAPLLESHDIFF